jgi:hypothetical protein
MLLISHFRIIAVLTKSSIIQQLKEINSMLKTKTVLSQSQAYISGNEFKNCFPSIELTNENVGVFSAFISLINPDSFN